MSKRWLTKNIFVFASVLSLTLPSMSAPVKAADDMIRVALFVDTGQGYRGVVPSVTITGEAGIEIKATAKQASASIPVSDKQARFRVDEFSLIVEETSDLQRAERVAQLLNKQKLDASITQENGAYQVISGSFTTYEAAQSQSKVVSSKIGQAPSIIGPYRVEAGRYKEEAEANNWESAYEASGLRAHTVLLLNGSKPVYSVWVGDEISKSKLNQVIAAASRINPEVSFNETNEAAYVVMKKEVVASGNDLDTVPLFAFSPQVKLHVTPKKSKSLLTVEERDHRKYRGKIELSDYKGNLTVVNELPLEQYLYGVVGTEMVTGWPMEALKTQAVLARTRAVGQGNKYGVANLSDTVYEQAYYGYGKEAEDIRRAVDETAGEIIRYRGKVAQSLFYSNAGGMTADGSEVWGNPVPYLPVVDSFDTGPMETAMTWYQVSLDDGTIGYVRSDFIDVSDTRNPMGLMQGRVNIDNLNFRIGPSTSYHRSITTLPIGTQVTIISSEPEENAYSWTRGPYTATELTAIVNASQARNKAAQFSIPIESIEVTKRGPSGRVMEMQADGMAIAASSPDAYRSVFQQNGSSLRSTKFEIEQMGSYTVLGANNKTVHFPQASFELYAVGADDVGPITANNYSDEYIIFSGNNEFRVASKQPKFVIRGYGFGHGLGVSQFGAKGLAEQGYDYRQILQHYYQDVTIEP
ncbi:SpoIID/LytB domain-containing protein [Brevibacillus sp. SYSU BS000544]|uniref:SpoIID/LytB domain-containing protein n=1 Tax=Brevibacillus sp. SYSU BS000544 TaxID=3416443 RepID=UPI003CE51066